MKKNKYYKFGIPIIFISIGLIILIIFICLHFCCTLINLDISDWITLVIGIVSAVLTAILSYFVYSQNKRVNDLLEKEKHSLLYFHNYFTHERKEKKSNFLKNAQNNSINYFILKKLKEENYDNLKFYEKLKLEASVLNGDLINLRIKKVELINFNQNCIFVPYTYENKEMNTCLVYDIENKKYIINLIFLTDNYINDFILSNQSYMRIELEYKNIFGIFDSRICDLNFFNSINNNKIYSISYIENK